MAPKNKNILPVNHEKAKQKLQYIMHQNNNYANKKIRDRSEGSLNRK